MVQHCAVSNKTKTTKYSGNAIKLTKTFFLARVKYKQYFGLKDFDETTLLECPQFINSLNGMRKEELQKFLNILSESSILPPNFLSLLSNKMPNPEATMQINKQIILANLNSLVSDDVLEQMISPNVEGDRSESQVEISSTSTANIPANFSQQIIFATPATAPPTQDSSDAFSELTTEEEMRKFWM